VSETPGVHFVPAATGMATDQVPEAQRWKDVPPRQLYCPSVVQAPDWLPVDGAVLGAAGVDADGGDGDEPEPDPDPDPLVGEGVDGASEDGDGVPEAIGAAVAVAVAVASGKPTLLEPAPDEGTDDGAVGGATVTKTPPGRVDATGLGTVEDTGEASELLWEEAGRLPDPDPAPEPPEPPESELPPFPLTAAQVPMMVSAGDPVFPETSGPGSGKMVSVPSLVVHPLSRLATKMVGRDEKPTSARFVFLTILALAAPIVTDAQLM